MPNPPSINMQLLENAADDAEYLQIILDKYNEVWSANPEKLMEIFSEEQLSFLIYGILYSQVYNGGFLQLIFNGYANYVFGSPLAQSLREWGAEAAAELLESIGDHCLTVANAFNDTEKSLDLLSAAYAKYPEFDEYDNRFYENDGTAEIKTYIAAHLTDFATV